jgi:type I restriction enzyme S subunit
MGVDWRASTWGEEVSLEYGKALRGHDVAEGRYRVFGSNGPIGWTPEALAPGPGVILGRKGAYRGVRYSPEPFFVIDTAYYVVPKNELDMRWLYYAIKHYKLGEVDDGSPIPSTTRAAVYMLDLDVPPPNEQRAIAHILGTLDDKIELNRRMNETLEAMARALFKSWFVDFDPVRAKSEGRDPGLPKPLADLFPDSFEDSELGEIPKGWEVKSLGDLLELAYGKALKAEDRHGGNVPVYGSNGLVGWHDERLAAGPGIVLGRKGNPGVATWAPTDFFAIDTAFYVVPKAVCRSVHFLFHVLKTHDLASLGADSAVPGLNRNLAYMSAQVLPPQRLLDKFGKFSSSLTARVHDCSEQSRTLAALRDTLLPKLISGELRVKDAEKFVERAAS